MSPAPWPGASVLGASPPDRDDPRSPEATGARREGRAPGTPALAGPGSGRDTSVSRPLRPGASTQLQRGPRPTRPRPGRAAGTAAGVGCASWAAAPRSLREVRVGRLARGGNGATRAKLAVPAGTRPSPAWAAAAPPAAGSAPASPSSGARGLSPTSPSTGGRTAAGAGRGGGARGLFKGTERRPRARALVARWAREREAQRGPRRPLLLGELLLRPSRVLSVRHERGWDQRQNRVRTWAI